MSKVQSRTEDFMDPDEDGGMPVLDLMASGNTSAQRFRHLEVTSDREFKYESIEEQVRIDGETFTVDNPGRSLAMEAFMQEGVVIEIAETTDEKRAPVVYVAVNGDERWLPRGVRIRVPRYFVERLAQANETQFGTPKIAASDSTDNERPVVPKRTSAYPFSVVSDPHPDQRVARRWLQRMHKAPVTA